LVSITDLTQYYDRAKLSWKPDGVGHDPKFLLQLDLTEVKREALSSGPFSGEGETYPDHRLVQEAKMAVS
jgi:hypothetical protein